MRRVSIIDYGIGNVLSVKRAFEAQGAEVEFVDTADGISRAERLVLPGVGAFGDGMKQLENRRLVSAIQNYCTENRPFLGICLGMQMMLDESEEFGVTQGLGIIHGKVVKIDKHTVDGAYQKVPHVGWNELHYSAEVAGTILASVKELEQVYFVHSFTARPEGKENRLADVYYGGHALSAVVRRGNCYGTQFHPEKSGEVGLQVIRNFMEIEG